MEKILVTGATGFVGNYVVKSLLAQNYLVIATSRSVEKAKQFEWFKSVEYLPLDIHKLNSSVNYFEYFHKPNRLIHLAWEGLPNYKSDFHLTENLPAHAFFLNNLIVGGLKDLSVMGTCFEYGLQEGCLKENMDAEPVTSYGLAKNKLRIYLQMLQNSSSFSLKWIRLFYLFGKGQNPNSLFSQLDKALSRGEKIFRMSGGKQTRDFMDIETASAIVTKISCSNVNMGIVNCCSGNPITVESFVKEFLSKIDSDIEIDLGYYPYSDFEPMHFFGDTTKLNTFLNGE